MVEIWNRKKQESIVLLTNHFKFAAAAVAATNRDRWKVALLLYSDKQILKIKTVLGTSSNAVETRIWTELIAMMPAFACSEGLSTASMPG